MSMKLIPLHHRTNQQGAAIVEFAIVAVVLFTLLLAIMDFGRILFAWNAAAEATRWGARVAVVCDKQSPDQIRDKMKRILPELTNANIVINYFNPEGTINNFCDATNCKGVEVSITGLSVQPISPFMSLVMPQVPSFQTYLSRESMEAINAAGEQNPVCFM
jgi:Flp pilus assembly protein TadG